MGFFFFAKRLRQIYIFEIPYNWLSVIGTLIYKRNTLILDNEK